jgi:hypothetical protein
VLSNREIAHGSRAGAARRALVVVSRHPWLASGGATTARQPLPAPPPPRPRAPHGAQAEVGAARGGGLPSQTNATIASCTCSKDFGMDYRDHHAGFNFHRGEP